MSGEIRIPNKLISKALSEKKVKQLRILVYAKLIGHRCKISELAKALRIHPKTCKRHIESITSEGWAGTDGVYLFPRSWRKLKYGKRGGLYLTDVMNVFKQFESLCFTKALKVIYRCKGSSHSNRRRVMQKDFPARYLYRSLGISERRFERLKATAQNYDFISSQRQFTIIGRAKDFPLLRKNLVGVPMFIRGKNTVMPVVSRTRIKI